MKVAEKSQAAEMSVPLLDLQAQYAPLRADLLAAIERVMDSQRFILGEEVTALEAETASYCGTTHAVGCASGSDALLLALMALGVHAGDEVITTPYSFFATAGSIARLGARPVFVDIQPDAYNIDAGRIAAAITDKTRAMMPVHLYGQCAEMAEISAIAEHAGIPVIEDAAQAIGGEDCGRRAGSMSAIGCFSYYPSKNLGGIGDGGMLTTNDDHLAHQLRTLRVHGGETRYRHSAIGINSRLDAIQAAALRVKFPHLDIWTAMRQSNALRYFDLFKEMGLSELVTVPFIRPEARHIFNQFVIRVDEAVRDDLISHLGSRRIGVDVYYPIPLHMQECFRYLGYQPGDFPESERAARETIALPIFPELTACQQAHVVNSIREFLA